MMTFLKADDFGKINQKEKKNTIKVRLNMKIASCQELSLIPQNLAISQ